MPRITSNNMTYTYRGSSSGRSNVLTYTYRGSYKR